MKKRLSRLGTLCLLLMLSMISKAETVTAIWDFHSADGNYYAAGSAHVEGSVGTLNATASNGSIIALTVDATNGKLNSRGSGDAQFNAKTIIRVPVISAEDVVTVVSYPGYHNYTIGGTAAEADTENHTATPAEAATGYVEIVGTGGSYLYSIAVAQKEGGATPVVINYDDVTAEWDFLNNLPAGIQDNTNYQGVEADIPSTVEGIVMHVNAINGKLYCVGRKNAQMNPGTILQIPVKSTKDVVTVTGYPGYSHYAINGVEATTDETSHRATAAEVAKGYVEVTATAGNNYIYSVKVVQASPYQEKVLYSTNFSDWTKASAAKTASTVEQQTKYSHETLTFNLFDTAVDPAGVNSKFNSGNPLGWLMASKSDDPYIQTSKLASVTKVRFVHAATGGNRGWKLEAKGDGDTDWVTISNSVANPAGWCEVNADVNRSNVELRWTNLNASQNAYMFELDIYGMVDMSKTPALGSFKVNGTDYAAADIFEEGTDGTMVATVEVSKKETMISASNPLTDITADNGEIGEITYKSEGTGAIVTIPVTANGETLTYVLTVNQKPDFTLTYYDADGTTIIGKQTVEKDAKIEEFAFDGSSATVADGKKFRGWHIATSGSKNRKFTVDEVITENTNLYALVTTIETTDPKARYEFELNDPYFYAEDHEAFASEGSGKYHDNQHGWEFNKGDQIKLLIGGKGYIKLGLCQYGNSGTIKLLDPDGEEVASINAKVSSDGAAGTMMYNGAAGEITLVFDNNNYLHNIAIVNMTEEPFAKDGDWYTVKAGDAASLLTTLEIANGSTSADKRTYIYIPNGTYDLGEKCLTQVSGQNISLIGESMDGVIIQNHPTAEGIGITATILNTSSNLYMQDLTLKNCLDYFNSTSAGRAVAFQDKGKLTICKNVKLLSYQDTYYSNGSGQFYWETSEIHGVVDYMCGGGDVYYNKCTLVNESRTVAPKGGSVTMTAPYPGDSDKFGYVFESCTIENLSKDFNFGRSWGGNSKLAFLNTIINQPDEIIKTRFTTGGMNTLAYAFFEYNSMDKDGNVVSPASNVLTFTKDKNSKTYETILKEEEAAAFAYDKLFTTWDPRSLSAQAPMPTFVKLEGTTLTWSENNADKMWAVLKNGDVVAFTTTASYTIDDAEAQYAVRAANKMGGLSEAVAAGAYATVTVADPGYATFFDSENNYKIPAGLKAKVVTAATTSALTYAELNDIIPAGTAVMLESVEKAGGEYTLPITNGKAAYTGANLLKGSDVATTTTADEQSLFYKLTYGSSKTAQQGTFGWFWGAADGGAFQIEGHRAWLAIPEQQAAAVRAYIIGGSGPGTTAIRNIETEDATDGEFYNLQGQRTYAPGKGIYIHNNKKVIIK